MSPNTWGNTANENVESNENIKKDSGNLLTKFYKEFADSLINSEWLTPEQKTENINKFINLSTLSWSELQEVINYKWSVESGEYDEIKPVDIELSPIKRELRNEFLKRKTLFQSVKKHILKTYHITSSQYSNLNLEEYIKTIDLWELSQIYSSSQKMDDFIWDFCENKWIEIFEKKSIKRLFEDLCLEDKYKEKLKDLSEDDLKEIQKSMSYLKNNIWQSDFGLQFSLHINTLLNKWLLNHAEVADIISAFTPFISLQDALKINNNIDVDLIKKENLNALEDLNFDDLDENTKREILSNVKNKDIFLSVEQLFMTGNAVNNNVIDKIIEEWLLQKIWDGIQQDLTDFENQWGPQNYNSFIKWLKEQNSSVVNPEKFISENYIILKTLTSKEGSEEKDENTLYYKIISDWSKKPMWNIILSSQGVWKYSSNNSKNYTYTYKEWIDFIEKWNTKAQTTVKSHEIYTEKELKDKVNSGDVLEDTDVQNFKTNQDLDWYKNQKKQDKIRELLNSHPEYNKLSEEEIQEKLEQEFPDFENELENEIKEWNKNYMVSKLKELDDSWDQYGFEEWTTVAYDQKWETIFFTIKKADNFSIEIVHDDKNSETMYYSDFYNAFKEKHAKRVNKTQTWDQLLENIWNNDDLKGQWSWIEISDWGTFIKKEKLEETEKVLDYEYVECELPIFWECDVMKIHHIWDNWVKVSYWKKTGHEKLKDKEAQEKKEEREKKEGKKISYQMWSETQTIPLWVFQAYLEKKWWIPKSFEEENSPEQHNDPESVERHWSFISRFMQRASINDLLAGWKLVLDSIESKLKEWTDEQAAKMVSELNWLPEAVKIDLDMRVEQASKKRMDEFKDRLGWMDSGKSTEMIQKVLLNKNSPEPMKEASIMFMAEKYGTLYEKWALHKYKWTFLRYEAFGWRIWDERYRKVEAQCNEDWVNFTEHELMIALLGAQCKYGDPKPKRRSKLHKEYKAMMWKWKSDEKEKWAKDGWEKRTIDGRLFIAYDELEGWAYLNSMWALKSVVWKWDWWEQHKLNEIPFIMMTSWDAYTYDQDTVDSFKNDFWPNGMPLPATFFTSKTWFIDLYNNSILEVCRIMSEDDNVEYWEMYKQAKDLILDNKRIKSDDKNSKEAKIKQAKKFYWKYWKTICRVMNMLNTRQTDKEAKYERLIWLENKKWNKILKEYYSIFNAAVTAETDFAKDDDTMSDAFYSWPAGTGGVSWMDAKKVFTDMLQTQSGSSNYRMKKSGSMMEWEFLNQLDAFKKIEYGSQEDKVNIVTDYIHGYFTAMMTHNRSGWPAFKNMFDNYKPMRKLWAKYEDFEPFVALDFQKDEEWTIAVSRKYAEKWLEVSNTSEGNNIFDNIIDTTKNAANDTMYDNREAA